MLADRIDVVIGVDTHTDTHTAAILNAAGAVLHTMTVDSTEDGYGQILSAILDHSPGPRIVWAIEGSGSYGTGLTDALNADASEVIEVRSVKHLRGRSKNDLNDAVSIARTALAQHTHAVPRTGETRSALRIITARRNQDVQTRTRAINAQKSFILTAPDALREKFRGHSTAQQIRIAKALRVPKRAPVNLRASIEALRTGATWILTLSTAINAAEKRLKELLTEHAAALLAVPGVGPINGAQLLITYSHPGRFRSEAAFAAITGTSPLEASSGRTIRHRLNRSGDRQANAAIHRVMHSRKTSHDPATMAYIADRSAQGKTPKEINRCLKRYLARQLYKILETLPAMP